MKVLQISNFDRDGNVFEIISIWLLTVSVLIKYLNMANDYVFPGFFVLMHVMNLSNITLCVYYKYERKHGPIYIQITQFSNLGILLLSLREANQTRIH